MYSNTHHFFRLRSSHPLIVRNNDSTLSWADYLQVQEAERELDDENFVYAPEPRYLEPRTPWCHRIKRYAGTVASVVFLSILLSSIPSFYVAKMYLNHQGDFWEIFQQHTRFVCQAWKAPFQYFFQLVTFLFLFFQAWTIGSIAVMGLFGLILFTIALRKYRKRQSLIMTYERINM